MSVDLPFAVRVELSSSIIPGQRLTLDAILASLIFARTRSVEIAHASIPLRNVMDVWAGSAALIEAPAPIRPVAVIQSLRAQLDISPDTIRPEKRGYPRIETARGNYRNQMSSYTAYDTKAIWFSGCGDIDKIRWLLEDLDGIGTKRSIGYGKVSRVDVHQTDADRAGLRFTDGTPARPIPIETWEGDSGIDCERALETYSPPYWNGVRVVCALPTHQIVSKSQAQRLVGVTQ